MTCRSVVKSITQSVANAVTTGDDWSLPAANLQLFLDATDETSMNIRRVADFVDDNTNATRLSIADSASLDYSNFSVEFWINKDKWRSGKGETYIAKGAADGTREFWIGHGSSYQDQFELQVDLYSDGLEANKSSAIYRRASANAEVPCEWCHVVIVYDGAQATDALKLRIWLNGQQLTSYGTGDRQLDYVNTVPSSVYNGTAAMEIGNSQIQTAWRLNARMSRVRFWTGALNGTNAASLWNNGDGIAYADLSASQKTLLAVALEMDEASGTREDSTANGNDAAEENGTVGSKKLVLSWTDKSSNGFVFKPHFGPSDKVLTAGAGVNQGDTNFGRAPVYDVTAANNLRLDFGPCHMLLCESDDFCNTGSGAFVIAFKPNAIPYGGEQFALCTSSDTDPDTYFILELDATLPSENAIRWSEATPEPDTVIKAGQSVFAAGTPYLVIWRGLGSGDAASYETRINRTSDALTSLPAALQNTWLDDMPGRNNISIGTLTRSDAVQGAFDWNCGSIAVYGPTNGPVVDAIAEAYIGAKHGL